MELSICNECMGNTDIAGLCDRNFVGDITSWVDWILCDFGREDAVKIVTIAWAIWNQRNVVLHGAAECLPKVTLERAMTLLEAYKMAHMVHEGKSGRTSYGAMCSWQAHPLGVLKINADGATFDKQGVGLGVIIRDHRGEVISAACSHLKTILAANITEAKAIILGLKLAMQCNARSVIVESDSLQVINMINNRIDAKSWNFC